MEKITFDDWKKVDLRIGQIKGVEDHPKADKLFILLVDLGKGEHDIQLVAGLKGHYEKKDLIGKKFGKLIVLSKVDKPVNAKSYGSYWLCLCNCGNKKVIKGKYLLNGHSKTCGCEKGRKRKDISGKRFGRLLAIKIDYVDRVNGAYWLCKCDCGKTKIFRRDALLSGTTNSCGCFRREEHIKRLKKLRKGKDTYIEKIIESLLKTLKIKIKKQFIIKNTIRRTSHICTFFETISYTAPFTFCFHFKHSIIISI